eukprot:366152-Chlamydomonas_euryale.AAC.7
MMDATQLRHPCSCSGGAVCPDGRLRVPTESLSTATAKRVLHRELPDTLHRDVHWSIRAAVCLPVSVHLRNL